MRCIQVVPHFGYVDIVGARYVMSPASAVDYPGAVFALGRRDEHPDPFSLRDDSSDAEACRRVRYLQDP
jgi:hypothetical protein